MLRKEEEARKQMTPEEIQQEKERMKLQEEEEQLMLAQELMGMSYRDHCCRCLGSSL